MGTVTIVCSACLADVFASTPSYTHTRVVIPSVRCDWIPTDNLLFYTQGEPLLLPFSLPEQVVAQYGDALLVCWETNLILQRKTPGW